MGNKFNFSNQLLFVGPTPATGQHFNSGVTGLNLVTGLNRIQSINWGHTVNRQDVNQYGMANRVDSVILDAPTVPLSFSYLLANLWNEHKLGFSIGNNWPALSGILRKQSDEKNYFIKVSEDGIDAVSGICVTSIGIGNGFITSYSTTAAVGALPEVTVNIEGSNLQFVDGASGHIPALDSDGQQITNHTYVLTTGSINPTGFSTADLAISVLRPGDIQMSFKQSDNLGSNYDEAGMAIADSNIQSYTLSLDIGREQLQKLGNRVAVSREAALPINVSLDVESIGSQFISGSLYQTLCEDTDYDITINLHEPNCSGGGDVMARYQLKRAKLVSKNYNGGIGGNLNTSYSFTAQANASDATRGFFLSGVYQ